MVNLYAGPLECILHERESESNTNGYGFLFYLSGGWKDTSSLKNPRYDYWTSAGYDLISRMTLW